MVGARTGAECKGGGERAQGWEEGEALGSSAGRGGGGEVGTGGPGQTEAQISKQNSDRQGLGWGLREAPWWFRWSRTCL